MSLAILGFVLAAVPGFGQLASFEERVEDAQEKAHRKRYQEVLDLLEPLENFPENQESQYIVAAELGRASFHLGQYQRAHERFRRAVSIFPDRVETALYLEATAYLLGDREQAFMILREVLRGGAQDLYLAVTLPGERQFLRDPEVWRLIEEFAVPMRFEIERGSVLGLELGQPRAEVEETLGVAAGSQRVLTAEAGPHLIWGFAFSDQDLLNEITVHVENVVKYTPYRPVFDSTDWRATPAHFTASLGPPSRTFSDGEYVLVMSWQLSNVSFSAAFGHPRPPRPPGIAEGVAMLRMLRFESPTISRDAAGRNSGTIPP
jgi:tetratricopeptide (TPR) repeat protein